MRRSAGTGFLLRVSQALEQVAEDYDFILMDSAPSLNFLTLSSLTAATGVIIPVPAHMLDVGLHREISGACRVLHADPE